jgi:hypothetical protein
MTRKRQPANRPRTDDGSINPEIVVISLEIQLVSKLKANDNVVFHPGVLEPRKTDATVGT